MVLGRVVIIVPTKKHEVTRIEQIARETQDRPYDEKAGKRFAQYIFENTASGFADAMLTELKRLYGGY